METNIKIKVKKQAVVLLSGGLDSLTCLAIAVDKGYDILTISFDYGQKHSVELQRAVQIAKKYNCENKIVKLDSSVFQNSSLTDLEIKIPEVSNKNRIEQNLANNTIPNTYVPARNTIFLSYALGFAEITQAQAIFIGVNALDYSGYPDCRAEFIDAFAQLAQLATAHAVMGHPVEIKTPLLHLTKKQIIDLGVELGVDYSLSVSCYQANDKGEACGVCEACCLRYEGFKQSAIDDPTIYIKDINLIH